MKFCGIVGYCESVEEKRGSGALTKPYSAIVIEEEVEQEQEENP